MSETKLTENQARALYMLDSRHYTTGPGFMMLSDLNEWGYPKLDLDNLKRQLTGGLQRKGLCELSDLGGGVLGFRLTERAYPALSRWLHHEGGEETVNTWF